MTPRPILALLGLALCLAAGLAILLRARQPGKGRPYLALVFLEAGLYFLSECLASLAGPSALSLALNFGSSLYALPSLYLYARDRSGEPAPSPWRHYVPALLLIPLGVPLALRVATQGFRGGLGLAAFLLGLPLVQGAQLLAYGPAALRRLSPKQSGDGTGRDGIGPWPRRTVWISLAGFSAFLALSLAASITAIAGELFRAPALRALRFDSPSLLAALLLVWTLGLALLWGAEQAEAGRQGGKYGGRPLPGSARLLERLQRLLAEIPDLAEIEPRGLAARLGVSYHDLSRAVNEGAGMSIPELLNDCRVRRAQRILDERPEIGLLEAGLEAGFSSKSTFNAVFKHRVGMSPGDYRRARRGGPAASSRE